MHACLRSLLLCAELQTHFFVTIFFPLTNFVLVDVDLNLPPPPPPPPTDVEMEDENLEEKKR